MDALLVWLLGGAKKLVNAEKELFGEDRSNTGEDVAARQQKMLDSKEELLRCAKVSQQILNYAGTLDQFIGESDVVILEGDGETAHGAGPAEPRRTPRVGAAKAPGALLDPGIIAPHKRKKLRVAEDAEVSIGV